MCTPQIQDWMHANIVCAIRCDPLNFRFRSYKPSKIWVGTPHQIPPKKRFKVGDNSNAPHHGTVLEVPTEEGEEEERHRAHVLYKHGLTGGRKCIVCVRRGIKTGLTTGFACRGCHGNLPRGSTGGKGAMCGNLFFHKNCFLEYAAHDGMYVVRVEE